MRKANCNHRRRLRVIDSLVKHVGVAYVTGGSNKCELVQMDQCRVVNVGMAMARAICETPHQWSILIAAMCIDANGKQYFKSKLVVLGSRYYQRDLVEVLNEEHQAFITKEVNKSHMVAAGWLASPTGGDICTEKANTIFEKLGAWA